MQVIAIAGGSSWRLLGRSRGLQAPKNVVATAIAQLPVLASECHVSPPSPRATIIPYATT